MHESEEERETLRQLNLLTRSSCVLHVSVSLCLCHCFPSRSRTASGSLRSRSALSVTAAATNLCSCVFNALLDTKSAPSDVCRWLVLNHFSMDVKTEHPFLLWLICWIYFFFSILNFCLPSVECNSSQFSATLTSLKVKLAITPNLCTIKYVSTFNATLLTFYCRHTQTSIHRI